MRPNGKSHFDTRALACACSVDRASLPNKLCLAPANTGYWTQPAKATGSGRLNVSQREWEGQGEGVGAASSLSLFRAQAKLTNSIKRPTQSRRLVVSRPGAISAPASCSLDVSPELAPPDTRLTAASTTAETHIKLHASEPASQQVSRAPSFWLAGWPASL